MAGDGRSIGGVGSFGALLIARGLSPARSGEEAPQSGVEEPAGPDLPAFWGRQTRVGLGMERKGRGGKVVTLVHGLQGVEAELETAARQIRQVLGCGATVEEGVVTVQGDQRTRLRTWLQAAGVREIRG